jgi:hypothetical protein
MSIDSRFAAAHYEHDLHPFNAPVSDVTTHHCACGTGDTECPNNEGVPLCCVAPQQPVAVNNKPVFTLNARQLRSALDFIAPDFDNDEDQRDVEISMQIMPYRMSLEDEPMPAGLYAWCTDYPEEGCILLLEDETRFELPASTNQPVATTELTAETIRELTKDAHQKVRHD